jgi:carboxyl-terminal processing protease
MKKLIVLTIGLSTVVLCQSVALAAESNEMDANTLTAQQTRFVEETLIEGSITGIGIELDGRKGILLVKRILSGGGAAKAGLKAGEVITFINGRSTEGMALNQAVDLIKGPAGTKVNLTVRDTEGKSRVVAVERGTVLVSGVECREVNEGIWLIRISAVNKKTPAVFRDEIDKLEKRNAKGMILDVRDDRGGYYQAVVEIANMFVSDGRTMWLYKPKDGDMERVRAEGNQVVTRPVAVLVSKDTEVCELIAAAMKSNQRAKLIGQKTSGLAAKRNLVKKEDGSSEKVVIGTFFYSPEVAITGRGVEPDIRIDANLSEQEIIAKAVDTLKLEAMDKRQEKQE